MTVYRIRSFPGWRKVNPNEIVRQGDSFVRIDGTCPNMTPETGDAAECSVGKLFSDIINRNRPFYGDKYPFWLYRRGSDVSIPRRIVGSKSFSSPLPLP